MGLSPDADHSSIPHRAAARQVLRPQQPRDPRDLQDPQAEAIHAQPAVPSWPAVQGVYRLLLVWVLNHMESEAPRQPPLRRHELWRERRVGAALVKTDGSVPVGRVPRKHKDQRGMKDAWVSPLRGY